jgi:hypothetical protein
MLKAIALYGVVSCMIIGPCLAEREGMTMKGQIVASKIGFLRLPGIIVHAEYLFKLSSQGKGYVKLVYSSPDGPPKKLTVSVLNTARMLRIKANRDKSCDEVYGSFNKKVKEEIVVMREGEFKTESTPREIDSLSYIEKAGAIPPPDEYKLECYSVSDSDIKLLN